MEKGVLERYWRGPSDLGCHEIVGAVFEEIRNDVRAGQVFPAFRENEIHLYHEGGRLLRIRPRSAYAHGRYAHGSGSRDVSLQEPLTSARYGALKERCRERNERPLSGVGDARRETWIVSRLFRRFSAWAEGADPDQPRLIDVEVRLRRNGGRSGEMVDLLFLDAGARLTFVEVKREYDGRIRSTETPEVVRQVRAYEQMLLGNDGTILSAYGKVGRLLGDAFGIGPFDAPVEVFPRVPILVCSGRRSGRERDVWLRPLLDGCGAGRINPEYLVVDGGAVGGDVYREGRPPPPWCASGVWQDVDLAQALDCVRGVAAPLGGAGSAP